MCRKRKREEKNKEIDNKSEGGQVVAIEQLIDPIFFEI